MISKMKLEVFYNNCYKKCLQVHSIYSNLFCMYLKHFKNDPKSQSIYQSTSQEFEQFISLKSILVYT